MKIDLNFLDTNNVHIKIGSTVTINIIQDDSGYASDLFGVEPQLNAWVSCIYPDKFTGVVKFDRQLLQVVIEAGDKSVKIPLSESLRHIMYYNRWECMHNDNDKEALSLLEQSGFKDDYDGFVNYIEVVK